MAPSIIHRELSVSSRKSLIMPISINGRGDQTKKENKTYNKNNVTATLCADAVAYRQNQYITHMT